MGRGGTAKARTTKSSRFASKLRIKKRNRDTDQQKIQPVSSDNWVGGVLCCLFMMAAEYLSA